eukprot:m.7613 g.7613  ORF g.7613 m.7613 type:complete len:385 (+) comp19184_c0_seq1:55-1209(+)
MTVSKCGNHFINLSTNLTQTDLEKLALSYLQYSTTSLPLAEIMLWILSVAAVCCNIAVIGWRLKLQNKNGFSNVSFLIINLAISDLLIAAGKILYLAATSTVDNWCQTATRLTKHLCIASIISSHAGGLMTGQILVTVALVSVRNYVKFCGKSPKETSRIVVTTAVISEWILGIVGCTLGSVWSIDGLALKIGDFNQSVNWQTCWTFGEGPADNIKVDISAIASFSIFLVLVAGSFVIVAVGMIRGTATSPSTPASRLTGLKMAIFISIDGVLVFLLLASNLYFFVNRKNLTLLLEKETFRGHAAANFIVPVLALLNPLFYTLLAKSTLRKIRHALRGESSRRKMKFLKSIESCSHPASFPNEYTALFPETSISHNSYSYSTNE